MRPRAVHCAPRSSCKVALVSLIVLGLLVCQLSGCLRDDDKAGEECPPQVPALTMPELASVPETTTVAGHTLTLDYSLWRDFMPIAPPNGDPLRAVIRVCDVESLSLTGELDLEYLWVINGEDTWSTPFNDEMLPPSPAHCVERIARCGPQWDTGIEVVVVVQIDVPDAGVHYLKALSVPIARTE